MDLKNFWKNSLGGFILKRLLLAIVIFVVSILNKYKDP